MKHKISDLEGALLDAAVAKVSGWERQAVGGVDYWWDSDARAEWWRSDPGNAQERVEWFKPSTDWVGGGRLIERERPAFRPGVDDVVADIMNERGTFIGVGPTYLVAFCRAYCASEFGEYVELPE